MQETISEHFVKRINMNVYLYQNSDDLSIIHCKFLVIPDMDIGANAMGNAYSFSLHENFTKESRQT